MRRVQVRPLALSLVALVVMWPQPQPRLPQAVLGQLLASVLLAPLVRLSEVLWAQSLEQFWVV